MMALVGLEQQVRADPATGREAVVVVGSATAMRRILEPGVALVVWQRCLGNIVEAELGQLALGKLDDIILTGPVGALREALAQAMGEAGYPALIRLPDDIVLLARQHADVIGKTDVRIRLEIIDTDACRRFHADYVTARTITTYLGQGTQWIESENPEDADLPGGSPIHQLRAGSVAMFKGRVWQDAPSILHRSPPITGSGEQRLVLVIDSAAEEVVAPIYIGATCS